MRYDTVLYSHLRWSMIYEGYERRWCERGTSPDSRVVDAEGLSPQPTEVLSLVRRVEG